MDLSITSVVYQDMFQVNSNGWYQIVPTFDFNMYISFIKMHKKTPLNLLMLNIFCSM
jgi:hypothetical protein